MNQKDSDIEAMRKEFVSRAEFEELEREVAVLIMQNMGIADVPKTKVTATVCSEAVESSKLEDIEYIKRAKDRMLIAEKALLESMRYEKFNDGSSGVTADMLNEMHEKVVNSEEKPDLVWIQDIGWVRNTGLK